MKEKEGIKEEKEGCCRRIDSKGWNIQSTSFRSEWLGAGVCTLNVYIEQMDDFNIYTKQYHCTIHNIILIFLNIIPLFHRHSDPKWCTSLKLKERCLLFTLNLWG